MIVASAGVGIAAAKGSTSTIPVVFFGGDDQAMLDGISAGSNAAKSILVFTDGLENRSPKIGDVAGIVTATVYAIGLLVCAAEITEQGLNPV